MTNYIWNSDLHREHANEKLVFQFLRVDSDYMAQPFVAQLRQFFEEQFINSYAVWELFGEDDLLIRYWAPRNAKDDLSEALEKLMGRSAVKARSGEFSVKTFACHQLWENHDIFVTQAISEIEPSDLTTCVNDVRSKALRLRMEGYRSKGWCVKHQNTKTLKFFMTISYNVILPAEDVDARSRRIAQTVAEIDAIQGASLYAVNGQPTFLLSGRIKASDYEAVSTVLRPRLHERGIFDNEGTTLTRVSSLSQPLLRQERLDFPKEPPIDFDSESLMAALKRGERGNVEVKGSCFLDLRTYGRSRRKLEELSHEEMFKNIVHAVSAFLHTEGGALVVGVLESNRVHADRVREDFPDVVELGSQLVIGIEPDMTAMRRKDPDEYLKHVVDKLLGAFDRSPKAYLAMDTIDVEGAEVLLIDVRPSPHIHVTRDGDGVFMRMGTSSRKLNNRELIDFSQVRGH